MLTLEMIQEAKKTLEGVARVTPMYESAFINPVMYEIPTETTVERCIITEEVVAGTAQPEYVHNENREPLQRMRKRKSSKNNVSAS